MTPAVTKTISSRPATAPPSLIPAGTERAMASETAPRIPATVETARARDRIPRGSGVAGRRWNGTFISWNRYRTTSSVTYTESVMSTSRSIAAAEISWTTYWTSRPMSTKSAPLRRKTPNGHAASACRRDDAVVTRGEM